MKILLNNGYVQFVFKDADTVTLTDTKLSATETNDAGNATSWEDTNFTTGNSKLIESVTAEDFILALWPTGPRHWRNSSYELNLEQRLGA